MTTAIQSITVDPLGWILITKACGHTDAKPKLPIWQALQVGDLIQCGCTRSNPVSQA